MSSNFILNEWKLDDINLLVDKNGSEKTKALEVIDDLCHFIEEGYLLGDCIIFADFDDGIDKYHYCLDYEDDKIKEYLSENGKEIYNSYEHCLEDSDYIKELDDFFDWASSSFFYRVVDFNDTKIKKQKNRVNESKKYVDEITAVNYSIILIDNFGNGLDYKNSVLLVEYLLEKIKNNYSQIIITSDNYFIINSFPSETLNVIKKNISGKHVINKYNSQ